MTQEFQALSRPVSKDASLTQGLARNTIFNLLGWAWPVGLALVSVPYILGKLGTNSYGIFSIVSIVAGYLGLLNSQVAMGNVRFMAESYAHEEWSELRKTALGGIVINGVLSLLGALIMFFLADVLVKKVFSIPAKSIETAVVAFRLAAVSFFLNGIVGGLQSIPVAMRRFDIRNQVGLVLGTLNTIMIVLALWLGWGLLGAVMAQVFSSVLGLAFFSIVAWRLLRTFQGTGNKSFISAAFVRRLASFSSLLFAGQITSQIGLQIDQALVGILLGTSALAYYAVPTKITERIPSMMYALATPLYPLSSEAMAANKLTELRQLYHDMIRILFWISAFIAIPLMVLSKEILALWIGPEFMHNSWLVFAFLAAGVVWRSSGSVAYQVCTGLGRADITLAAAIGTAVFIGVPVLIMAPKWGTPGVAFGMFIGLFLCNLAYDLFTQRKLLGNRNWQGSLVPYFRIILAEAGTIALAHFLPVRVHGWFSLIFKAGLVSLIFIALSLAVGALRTRDVKFLKTKALGVVKRKTSPIFSGVRR